MPENLTIVLPTANRPDFLARLVGYMAGAKFRALLLVADDGTPENFGANARVLEQKGQGLRCQHVGGEKTNVFEKIRRTLEQVTTPFCVLAADDDFFSPNGLTEAVNHLAANPRCSVSHGMSAVFTLDGVHGKILRVAQCTQQRSLSQQSGAERLWAHLSLYRPTWYSVERTPNMLRNWTAAAKFGADWRLGELIASCLSVIDGCVHHFQRFYMGRQANATSLSKDKGEYDWLCGAGWSGRSGEFLQILAERLQESDGMEANAALAFARHAYAVYVHQLLSGHEAGEATRTAALANAPYLRPTTKRNLWKRGWNLLDRKKFAMKCTRLAEWKQMEAAVESLPN